MATIAVCVYPLAGAINATRKLVKELRAKGHVVHYLGFSDCRGYLRGESFFAVFPNAFPPDGTDPLPTGRISLLGRLRTARLVSRRTKAFVKRLVEGDFDGFDRLMHEMRPELMVIQAATFYVFLWGLLAYRFNIPCVHVNSSLTGPENPWVPPISSGLQPAAVCGRLRTRVRWKRLAGDRRWRAFRSSVIDGWDLPRLAGALARGFGYPADLLEEHEKLYIRVKAPEIVLCPQSYDFAHPPWPDRYYSSASVDLSRTEVPFPWERLDPVLPVVLCSLGTTRALSSARYLNFFRCAVAAFEPFASRYQLVVSTNGAAPAGALEGGSHVVVVPEFPQIALLRRAAVMITHGGANSVKECLTLGIPMLLYPLGFDQFGHAARVVWRGAGLRIRRVSVTSLRDSLTRILTHSSYRLQALRISHEFQSAEETQGAAKCIETFLPPGLARLSRRERRDETGKTLRA